MKTVPLEERLTELVGVRLTKKEKAELISVAKHTHQTKTELLRTALFQYLKPVT
jgi:predicted transcriptional regulator